MLGAVDKDKQPWASCITLRGENHVKPNITAGQTTRWADYCRIVCWAGSDSFVGPYGFKFDTQGAVELAAALADCINMFLEKVSMVVCTLPAPPAEGAPARC